MGACISLARGSTGRMGSPLYRISTMLSSHTRKYCHIPHGDTTQISRYTTAVFGSLRSNRISSLNISAISSGLLICTRIRLTRTNTEQNKQKRTKPYDDPCMPAESSTTHDGIKGDKIRSVHRKGPVHSPPCACLFLFIPQCFNRVHVRCPPCRVKS